MKFLVTGGTGFVGKAVTRRLVGMNHQVVITTRDPDRARSSFPLDGLPRDKVEFVGWPGTAGALLDLGGIDQILHLAGEPAVGVRYTAETKKRIWDSRIESARALVGSLEACQGKRPSRLISASGVGYFGARPGDEVLTESAAAGTDFLARVCVEWEASIRGAEPLGVSTASARFGVILAGSGGALEVMAKPFRLFAGGPLGDGQQVLSWVHLDDVVNALLLLTERTDLTGPFNVTAPSPVTNHEFSEALGSVLGRPSLVRTPAFALKMLFGEGATPILTGQRAVPTRLLEAGFTFRFPQLRPALEECLQPETPR